MLIDRPRVIVAATGCRDGESNRICVRLMAVKGEVGTELEVYEGIRCLGTRTVYAESDAQDATVAGRVFNGTVRALTPDGVAHLEEIPAAYGYRSLKLRRWFSAQVSSRTWMRTSSSAMTT